jgi:hypothetical protein
MDLRARGLLDETPVILGGEFGRAPHAQNADGRDHNNKDFTPWLSGGGARRGFACGRTEQLGCEAVENTMGILGSDPLLPTVLQQNRHSGG